MVLEVVTANKLDALHDERGESYHELDLLTRRINEDGYEDRDAAEREKDDARWSTLKKKFERLSDQIEVEERLKEATRKKEIRIVTTDKKPEDMSCVEEGEARMAFASTEERDEWKRYEGVDFALFVRRGSKQARGEDKEGKIDAPRPIFRPPTCHPGNTIKQQKGAFPPSARRVPCAHCCNKR